MRKSRASVLEVASDPRIELLGVIQQLARPRARDARVEKRFGRFRGHPAVAAYRARGATGADSFALLLLFLGRPPALRWTRDRALASVSFIEQAGGAAELDAFLIKLRAFAAESRFMQFYAAESARRRAQARAGARRLASVDYMGALEAYAGEKLHCRYRVIWSLLYTPGELTSFIIPYPYAGPGRTAPGPFDAFTIPTNEERRDSRPYYLWNEPLYIPIERLWAAHESETASLPPEVKARLVSAAGWRLSRRHFGARGGATADAFVCARAHPQTRALYRRLAEYEGDRARWPTLGAFFPRLLDILREGLPVKC